MQAALTRHLKSKHKDNEKVKAAMLLPKVEQNRAFDKIKKEGIFAENKEKLKKTADQHLLRRERRQGATELIMCGSCQGFFSKGTFWKHRSSCSDSAATVASPLSCSALGNITAVPEFTQQVVAKIREDEVGNIAKHDRMITNVGQKM